MKKSMLIVSALALVLGTGCAGLTKGIETARNTALGLVDTVRVTVDKSFTVLSNGAGAAEKIAAAALPAAQNTVAPATTSQ